MIFSFSPFSDPQQPGMNVIFSAEDEDINMRPGTPVPQELPLDEISPSPARKSPEPPVVSPVTEQYIISVNKLLQIMTKMFNDCQRIIYWVLSPTNTIALFDPKQIWYFLLGHELNLTQAQYKQLTHYANLINQWSQTITSHYTNLDQYTKLTPMNQTTLKILYSYYKILVQFSTELKTVINAQVDLILSIQNSNEIIQSVSYQQPDDLPGGLEWLEEICKMYIKLEGPTPTTPLKMMKWFKRHHSALNDQDMNILVHNLEYHLGNISIELIATNLRTWILNNQSVIPIHLACIFEELCGPS